MTSTFFDPRIDWGSFNIVRYNTHRIRCGNFYVVLYYKLFHFLFRLTLQSDNWQIIICEKI